MTTQHAQQAAEMPEPFASMLAALDRFDALMAMFQEAAREEATA